MPSIFSRHPLVLQTAYSDLKRQALEQPFVLVGTAGSVGAREVKGRRFLYRQFYDAEGKKQAEYVGPEGDAAAERRASHLREQIAVTNALLRDGRLLAQGGYVRADPRTTAVLGAMANRGLFRAGAVLVGSHAYAVLLNDLGIRAAAFATEDVDIARGARLELAAQQDFAEVLAESLVPLYPVPALDRKLPATSYKPKGGSRFRVDLLVPARGTEVQTRAVPELAAHATALPFLGPLLEAPIEAVVLGRESVVPVRVPRPEAFAWHKMVVSQERATTSDKRAKDVLQASVVFAFLAEDAPEPLEGAFRALPSSARTRARAGAVRVRAQLEAASHERAVELLDGIVGRRSRA